MIGIEKEILSPWKEVRSFAKNQQELIFILIILLIRIILAFITPLVTTDLERSLWYGDHFWSIFFDVYSKTPLDIDPNYNIIDPTLGALAWPNNTYDYPLLSILFFAINALIPIGIANQMIFVKFSYTGFDFINFLLLRRLNNDKRISLLYWLILTPLSALEGQPVSLTILFVMLTIWLYKEFDNPVFAFLFAGISFHWKYISVLLMPYLIIDLFYKTVWIGESKRDEWIKFLKAIGYFTISFVILWFPLLFSPYILSYISFGGNLPVLTSPWNPFYLGKPLSLSGFLLIGLILGTLVIWFNKLREEKTNFWYGAGNIPILGLWSFLLIYKYAFPWYWMWAFPLVSILPWRKNRINLSFLVICIIASVEFVELTVGLANIFTIF